MGMPINIVVNKTMIQNEFFKSLSENHPFITVCSYAGQDYVGIVQNRDDIVTTIYDYGAIIHQELREKFLLLGDVWWWESNRLVPINMFLNKVSGWNSIIIKENNNIPFCLFYAPVSG